MNVLPRDAAAAQQIAALRRINTAELLEALGLDRVRRGRSALEWLCRPAARHIAERMVLYDRTLRDRGLRDGARLILPDLGTQLEVLGADNVPRSGPLLIAANHPGLTDALAIFASLDRTDLRIVAADYPLLQNLCGIRQHLIFVPRAPCARLHVLRDVIDHLRCGGAILLMPAGRIEPDPAVLPGASASLDTWSNSIGLIVRRAPSACVVLPALVSGVLAASAQRHPLTRLRRSAADRQRLGTTLQVLAPKPRPVTVRLTYGQPLSRASLVKSGRDAQAITEVVIQEARRLLCELRAARSQTQARDRTSTSAATQRPDNRHCASMTSISQFTCSGSCAPVAS